MSAQNPVYEHLANISDLPDVVFYDILEDQEHYIWLAAEKGLYRYDGKSYIKFTNTQQKVNSVFQLQLDRNGNVWCNNIYGQIFYVKDNKLNLFYDANSLVKGQLAPFKILDKSIRLFTRNGVYNIDNSSKKVTKFNNNVVLSASSTKEFTNTIVNDKTLNWFQQGNNKTQLKVTISSNYYTQTPKIYSFKNNVSIFTFKEKNKNKFYWNKSYNHNVIELKTPKELTNITIYNILYLNNNYWFLTDSGVFIYTIKNNNLVFKEQLYKEESITDALIDFNNNYWFTTLDNGVFVSSNLNIRRINLTSNKHKITAACKLKENTFLLGTNNGKLLFYNKTKLYKTIQLPDIKIIGNLFYNALNNVVIVSINGSESYVVNLNTFKITDKKNKYSVAKALTKINDSMLFYGNFKDAIIYYKPNNTNQKQIIRSNRVKEALVINNTLFVSFIDGLYQFNTTVLKPKEITLNNQSVFVNSMAKINNTVWLATLHNKLYYLKDDTLHIKKNILPKDSQINTLKADNNFLWISTDKSLYRYNTVNNEIKRLNTQSGQANLTDKFIILDDYLITIFSKFIYIIPKKNEIFKTIKTSKILLESVKINFKDSIVKQNYSLPHNYNNIKFNFNSNGFKSNQNVSYKYKVKEIDSSWHDIPINTHFVAFNSLASGNYTFQLQAKNTNSVNVQSISPVSITINKAFWQTYWFYATIFLIILTIFWLFFKWRLEKREREKTIQIDRILTDKKITNLKLENLRSQMNPHFVFNALNSIQDYIVSNKQELASSYLVKFSRLIRMYLDFSQQNEITLNEELKALKLYLELEKVRFDDELNYTLVVDKNINSNQIKVPSLFIQPYVENALKHGLLHKISNRQLYVIVKKTNTNEIEITVKDNGIGRKESEYRKQKNNYHKPFATKANQERVSLYRNKLKRNITIHTEDLYNTNNEPNGTKVIITMSI